MSLPAFADDLQTPPQQLPPQEVPGDETGLSKAARSLSDRAQPGNFRWTMLDEDGQPQDEAPLLADPALTRSLMFSADTPTETIEAQMRVVAAQVVEEARRAGNVESFRFHLRVRCVSEDRVLKRDPLAATSSMPWIWTARGDEPQTVKATVEVCSVSVSQSVQMRENSPEEKPYSVLLPIGQSEK